MMEDISDWNLDAYEGVCDCCKERKMVQSLEDPFKVEGIYDSGEGSTLWCYECYDVRSGDI